MTQRAPNHRSLVGKINADLRWAFTQDRTEATARAREAFMDRFELLVDPGGTLTVQERTKRAANLKRAHFTAMALKSAEVRRARAAGRSVAPGPISDPSSSPQGG